LLQLRALSFVRPSERRQEALLEHAPGQKAFCAVTDRSPLWGKMGLGKRGAGVRRPQGIGMRKSLKSYVLAASALALLAFAGPAAAVEQLIIKADQATMISVPGEPGAIIVGNPSIADATANGKQIFLHGRVWGTTNVIILDTFGAQLASFEVTVVRGGEYNVVTWRAGRAYSTVCAPDCEKVLQIGDSPPDRFVPLAEEQMSKINIATGKTSTEATPAPAQ
jgi:Pilus formation protein N terminal region